MQEEMTETLNIHYVKQTAEPYKDARLFPQIRKIYEEGDKA